MNFKTDFQIFKSDFFLSQIFFPSQIFQIFKSQKFCETENNQGKLEIVFSEAAQERNFTKVLFQYFLTLAKVTFLFYNLKRSNPCNGS